MNYKKISLLLLIAITNSIHSTAVVFLQGTSRSGKSSICSAIRQCKGWDAVGSVYFSYCLQVFNDLFPEEFACIKNGIKAENIRHAVTRNIFLFKKGISKNQKKDIKLAAQKIQSHFNDPSVYTRHKKDFSTFSLNEVESKVKKGLHVLADVSWYVTQENIQNITPTPRIFSILVYCPFNTVINRLLHRNKISLETGNIMNYRFFFEPLKSFASLYDLSPKIDNSIDKIEKNAFFACLDLIESFLPHKTNNNNSRFMMNELTHEQLEEYRKTYLQKFGDRDFLYLVPKIKYDMLLKTDTSTPQECVDQVVTYIMAQGHSSHKE